MCVISIYKPNNNDSYDFTKQVVICSIIIHRKNTFIDFQKINSYVPQQRCSGQAYYTFQV